MNLTLGTLDTLKAFLLPEEERSGTQWDAAITTLGKGVAAVLERHCNRRFAYLADDVFEFSADRAYLVLPRYPVVAIARLEIRRSLSEGWVELPDVIANLTGRSGFILFTGDLGGSDERVRITYSGGYVLQAEASAPSASALADAETPAVLPDDLQLAWLQQCAHLWRQKDKLGGALAQNNGEVAVAQIDLLPGVVAMVAGYRRLSLS